MILMGYTTIISILIGVLTLFIVNRIFGFSLRDYAKDLIQKITESIADYNTKRHIDRLKRTKIQKRKRNLFDRYNDIVESLIYDFNLPLTLEGFNSLIAIVFAILALVFILFLQSVTLSVFVSISLLVGFITYFTMQSRLMKTAKLESIMDAEDLICPLAREGVLVAIKKVLESEEYINKNIRHYFVQFVENCENHGYSFKRAMDILNKQLGPKFDGFAKKAVIFEYNERKGMADIFLDIVDENAALREINARKNRVFKKMNFQFLMKTAIIIVFISYMMTIDEVREFLLLNDKGRFINAAAIITICLSFARCQALQSDIGSFGGDK